MNKKKQISDGIKAYQEQSVKETEVKIKQALEKQRHAKVINKSQLARDAGLSRPTINEYAYLYDDRAVNKPRQVTMLEEQLKEQQRENDRLRKENTRLREENNKLTDKLTEWYVIGKSDQMLGDKKG